jgi:hypothetical protein
LGRRVNIAYPLHDPMVIKIAEKHDKHPAQVKPLLLHLKAFTGCLQNQGRLQSRNGSEGLKFAASSVLPFVLLSSLALPVLMA